MRALSVVLLAALLLASPAMNSKGGGGVAAASAGGQMDFDEVAHVKEGTGHDPSSSDGLHTHAANRIHIEYCSG